MKTLSRAILLDLSRQARSVFGMLDDLESAPLPEGFDDLRSGSYEYQGCKLPRRIRRSVGFAKSTEMRGLSSGSARKPAAVGTATAHEIR